MRGVEEDLVDDIVYRGTSMVDCNNLDVFSRKRVPECDSTFTYTLVLDDTRDRCEW